MNQAGDSKMEQFPSPSQPSPGEIQAGAIVPPDTDEHDASPSVGQCCNYASRQLYGDCKYCGRKREHATHVPPNTASDAERERLNQQIKWCEDVIRDLAFEGPRGMPSYIVLSAALTTIAALLRSSAAAPNEDTAREN